MRVTLNQVAAAAELSVSTASRALNDHPAISADTKARVRRLAQKLRYKPVRSHRQRGLEDPLSGRNVAIISLGIDRSLLSLPVVAEALAGIEEALSEGGASVRVAHIPDLRQIPPGLRLESLDGAILTGPMQGRHVALAQSELVERLRELPTVWCLGRPAGCWGDVVLSNDYQTGTMAAEYLIERGHRHLAFLNPKPDHLLFVRREDGFVGTARRLGAEVQSFCESPPGGWQLPLKPPLNVEAVQNLVDRVLAMSPRPTAIFAAADSVATLVYRALAVRELTPGRDMSVISANDDRSLIAGLHPDLTTYDVHASQIGRFAVRQLGARMADPDAELCTDLMVPSTLVEGQSVVELPET